MNQKELEALFFELYEAPNEQAVTKIISNNPVFDQKENWKPLGGNDNNFGVIENQQSSPIAALIEKVTNSIDAILTKKCLQQGISPDSADAPSSIKEAIETFFPNSKDWDLDSERRKQALNIQIVADGKPRNTSVIIYDDGEGQRPEDFHDTFLSLLRGNKNKIMFVQGKYNMGGSPCFSASVKTGNHM